MPPTPPPCLRLPPASIALSPTLLALSAPSPAPSSLSLVAALSSHLRPLFFFPFQRPQPHSHCQKCLSPADWRALSPFCVFPAAVGSFLPSRDASRWIFRTCSRNCPQRDVKSCIDCTAFKPQSAALFSSYCLINKQTCTHAEMFANSRLRWQKSPSVRWRCVGNVPCWEVWALFMWFFFIPNVLVKPPERATTQMPSCHWKVCTDLFTWSSTSVLLHLTNHRGEHQMWTLPPRCRNDKLFISNRLQDICAKKKKKTSASNFGLLIMIWWARHI